MSASRTLPLDGHTYALAPKPPATGQGTPEYVPALDGLRFFAFLLVFAFHSIPGAFHFGDGPASGIARAFALVKFGWIGVDLFFCLSAYLLTRLLLLERQRFNRVDVPHFYIRRALRIWPLYFCMLVIGFVIVPLAVHLAGSVFYAGGALWRQHLIPYLLFLGNWSTALYAPVPSSALDLLWTISVEEQFYLALPLVVMAFPTRRPLTRIAIGVIVFSLLVRAWLVANGAPPPVIYRLTPTRLDCFAVGVLLALYSGAVRALVADRRRRLLVAGLLMVFLGLAVRIANADATYSGKALIPLYLVTAAAAGCCLTLSLGTGTLARFLSRPGLVYLGKISYGLYVFHASALLAVTIIFRRLGFSLALVPLVGLAVTIAVAVLSYRVLERPFLLLKSRFTAVASRPI